LVDVASPSINAAVEVDCGVKASVSKKVDDHLTASAMMTNDHQQMIRREVVGLRWNLRHRNMQSAIRSANIKLSRLPDIENGMLLPALRMSASSRTEIASEPLRGSVDIARLLP
jgi:hypothetical protein